MVKTLSFSFGSILCSLVRKMSGKEGASGVEGGASGAKTIQSLNIHSMKIDVEKFNGTNNFGLWRCEVLDALNAQNLEDTLELDGKPDEIEE